MRRPDFYGAYLHEPRTLSEIPGEYRCVNEASPWTNPNYEKIWFEQSFDKLKENSDFGDFSVPR